MIRLACALVALSLAPAPAAAQTARPAGPSRTAIVPVAAETDHLKIVSTIGEGPPVILIPGLASPRAVWDGVLPELARRQRVHLVEVRGFAGGDIGGNGEPRLLDGIVADQPERFAAAVERFLGE